MGKNKFVITKNKTSFSSKKVSKKVSSAKPNKVRAKSIKSFNQTEKVEISQIVKYLNSNGYKGLSELLTN